jgi:hypothetical protein
MEIAWQNNHDVNMFINWQKVRECFSQLQDFNNNVHTFNHCAWGELEGQQTHHVTLILWVLDETWPRLSSFIATIKAMAT